MTIPHDPPLQLCTTLVCPVLDRVGDTFRSVQTADLVVGVVMFCLWLVALFWAFTPDDDART